METEGAEMLESLLPSKFKYRVKEVKILEQSEVREEVKFHASFDVNICRKVEVEELFLFIAAKNGTNMKDPRKEKERMGFRSNRFNCGRRIRDRRSTKDDNEGKRSGQGRLKRCRKTERKRNRLWSPFHIQTASLHPWT